MQPLKPYSKFKTPALIFVCLGLLLYLAAVQALRVQVEVAPTDGLRSWGAFWIWKVDGMQNPVCQEVRMMSTWELQNLRDQKDPEK